ncbi:MAG TPA: c-type cytochrome [Candidatus Binatia bacterium]|nr:c-type cytochrome [Candidatus Binatia bacterium]
MQFVRRLPRPLALAACVLAVGLRIVAADGQADKTALAVEVLSRLQEVDLNTNPKLKETVFKLLERTRGTPNFVRLVRQFKLTDQNAGLLEVAADQPASESGVEAMRLILDSGDTRLLETTLAGTNSVAAVRTAEALGNTGEKRVTKLLLPLVTDPRRDGALRSQAVRSLAKTSAGADALLNLAKEENLSADLKGIARTELTQARWPEIQSEAAKVLPAAQEQNSPPLPPIAQLLKMKGDIANGARLFTNASPGCASCHVVRGRGTDLGPNLSEIGTKLGRDAILQAILEPSAGISFGYEAFNFTLQNGDEAYGLIASQTAEEVTVKAAGGILTRLKKKEIVSRQQSKLSLMPAALQAGLTPQELMDLVEYLASLKKP